MKRNMECCCCGEGVGRFEQWWNRDTGYSICARCVELQSKRETPEEMRRMYGEAGTHYPTPEQVEEKEYADDASWQRFLAQRGFN